MLLNRLHDAIAGVEQSIVGVEHDPLLDWRLAERDAADAYAYWRRSKDADSYAVYRACADRADAAQDALFVSVRCAG
jgi:hypothetical protein